MARVFIIEPPTVNVDKAKRFGDIHILLKGEPRLSALDSDRFAGRVIEALEEFDFQPQDDYLGLVGPLSAVAISLAAMVTRWKGIRCLIYNGGRNDYVLRRVGRWAYQSKWETNSEEG